MKKRLRAAIEQPMPPRFLIAALLAFSSARLVAAEPEVDSGAMPRVPATPPDRAVSTLRVKPGFRADLVAAEPLVVDPIAMSFDENGRLYVVEMRDYSERRPERLGRVRLLEDTDGDGRFDKATVFTADLPWPTAVICWDGGVFIGATPDILYCKDTDGDGVADVREIIFTGFAADYAPFATNKLNVQALMNSFNWSLDNRIHGATSFSGGKVRLVDSPFVRAWLKGSAFNPQSTELRGRDFSFDPRTLALRAESGGGQHGMSFDAQGRKFVCANSSHIQAILHEERYAAQNSAHPLSRALVDIAVDGGAAPVFRLSPDEPWRVLRTQWRVSGLVPGPVEGGGRPSGYFTGATGVTLYRGDAFGPDFAGDAFIGDAGGNLVHRKKILRRDGGLQAVRPADEANVEFLASTDNWFRPVQMANAPDGCLYICDMYREVIEHPWSLPDSLKKHLDLNSGSDRGRLWRVAPEKFRQSPPPRLGAASTAQLVATLEHANGWHRDTAARLLFARQDATAIPALKRLATKSRSALGRLHALHALAGLNALGERAVLDGLTDHSPDVRVQALRLAEALLMSRPTSSRLVAEMRRLARDPDAEVRRQLAFTAIFLPRDARVRTLTQLVTHPAATEIKEVIAHSIGDDVAVLFVGIARMAPVQPATWTLLSEFARAIGSRGRAGDVIAALDASSGRELFIAASLGEGVVQAGGSFATLAGAQRVKALTDLALNAAGQTGTNATADVASSASERPAALRVLGLLPSAETTAALLEVLGRRPQDGAEVFAALNRHPGAESMRRLLERWPMLSPGLRREAVGFALKRAERIPPLLDALEGGAVQVLELSAAQMEFLRGHSQAAIRERARGLLSRMAAKPRLEAEAEFRPALALQGRRENGRGFFQARCASCHQLNGEGHALGPDLATVRNGGREKLLANIVDPNREVNVNYLGYQIETRAGETLVGLIVNESGDSVTLRMAGGVESVLPRNTIASMRGEGRSLMPEGLEGGMTAQDMADLLEFILASP